MKKKRTNADCVRFIFLRLTDGIKQDGRKEGRKQQQQKKRKKKRKKERKLRKTELQASCVKKKEKKRREEGKKENGTEGTKQQKGKNERKKLGRKTGNAKKKAYYPMCLSFHVVFIVASLFSILFFFYSRLNTLRSLLSPSLFRPFPFIFFPHIFFSCFIF